MSNTTDNTITAQPVGELSLQTICMPADTNWMGDIFGGWLLSQMDIAGAIHARNRSQGRVTTVAVDDMSFHVPVHVGDVIKCYTSFEKIGNTSLVTHIEVWAESNACVAPIKVTEGRFIYVAIDNNGNKRQVPKEVC